MDQEIFLVATNSASWVGTKLRLQHFQYCSVTEVKLQMCHPSITLYIGEVDSGLLECTYTWYVLMTPAGMDGGFQVTLMTSISLSTVTSSGGLGTVKVIIQCKV